MVRLCRKATGKRGLTQFHAMQLAAKYDYFHAAWGDLHEMSQQQREQTLQQMREAWQRPEVQQQVQAAFLSSHAAWQRPWAWWQFSSPQPRDENQEEHLQLYEMGLLPKSDAAAIAQQSHERYMRSHYFHGPFQLYRRLPSWWALCAPEHRKKRQSELQQLTRLRLLITVERELLHADKRNRLRWMQEQKHLLQHLLPAELKLLGLLQK